MNTAKNKFRQDLPAFNDVRRLLSYEPKTGVLRWTKNVGSAKAGDAVSTLVRGYVRVRVLGRSYMAHRVAWLLSHGEWPSLEIDHIDGIKTNNVISNLRLASRTQNIWNTGAKRDNTSGYKGVWWDERSRKWRAGIRVNGRSRHIGVFDAPEAAAVAYAKEAVSLHGEFARL